MNPDTDRSTDTTRTLGEIAASSLAAIEVLERFGLDYCCDGRTPLAEAAARAGLDVNRVIERLDARRDVESAETAMETDALVGRIVDFFHARHRSDLPRLLELAERVETVHQFDANTPHGLADALERLQTVLIPLMVREERVLFPALCEGDHAAVAAHQQEAGDERSSVASLLHEIEQVTGDFSLPEGACRTWRTLYFEAARFDDELRYHMHLENNVLLARLDQAPGSSYRPTEEETS